MSLLATLLATVTVAAGHHGPCDEGAALHRRHCRVHRACDNAHPKACVENAIIHGRRWLRPWGRWWLRATPACESGWDPKASSAGNLSLYQFRAGTWASTPYRRRSIWSAKWQALAAAWMLHHGRTAEWPNCP